MDFSRT